jgi:hypothetical protein
MMEPRSADLFANVEPDNDNENGCTPRIGGDFIGIRINAPEVIDYTQGERDPITGAFGRAILCGIYRFESALLLQTEGFKKTATLVAVDTKTHQPYTAKMVHDHLEIPNPDPPRFSPEVLEGVYETGYFNINMLDFLGLPEQPATYDIFVTLQQHKSNVATVTLRPTGSE